MTPTHPTQASNQTLSATWNYDRFFPSLESAEFEAAYQQHLQKIAELTPQLGALKTGQVDALEGLERLVQDLNTTLEQQMLLGGYLHLYITTDSRNALAQGKLSSLEMASLPLRLLFNGLTQFVGGLDLAPLLERSEVLREHAFTLERMQHQAKHQMSAPEEELATFLSLSGGNAWSKLHGNITSQMMVEVDGEKLPMPAVRSLANHPDPAKREAAYHAELAAWRSVEVPLAAALNGIKGEANVLNRKRGYANSVEPTLFINNMDAETLAAMQSAVEKSLPDFQRYFKAKAKLLGKEQLAWFDITAPVGKSETEYSYDAACSLVIEQFRTFSDRMADFVVRAVDQQWMDVYPREGKIGGAFCMEMPGDESRILLNHDDSLDSVMTLAHELGHAYHNLNLAARTPLQREMPMTLAETASTFCEAILSNAALERSSGEERLYILESQLQGHAGIVLDIHSRFLFEKAVFEARVERELSPQEFSNLMLECQEKTYGDGVAADLRHPYMWAVKGHYYISGLSYYNYPYTFGALFSLGLYAEYKREPELFKARYDELLSSTGMFDAASLAARFGIDIRSEKFWAASLEVIKGQIEVYVGLVG
jgi:oligoendopeptidase F